MTEVAHIGLTREQQDLVRSALHIVERVASQLDRRYQTLVGTGELLALGREGLVRAARAYDPSLGVPFAIYATYRVQGAMLDGVRKEATRSRQSAIAARIAGSDYLAVQRDSGDVLTDTEEDCKKRLDAFAEGLAAAMFAGFVGAGGVLLETAEDEVSEREEYRRAVDALDKATEALPERDRKLLHLHYREQRDLKEVATALGVSYASVRRYHAGAIGRLAIRLRAQGVTQAPA